MKTKETENDAVMEKVDNEGNIPGFSILKVSALKEHKPISVILKPVLKKSSIKKQSSN